MKMVYEILGAELIFIMWAWRIAHLLGDIAAQLEEFNERERGKS